MNSVLSETLSEGVDELFMKDWHSTAGEESHCRGVRLFGVWLCFCREDLELFFCHCLSAYF
ncbi:hypothetical protein SynBIOSE41_01939 [Synechococcus sp. BIOS-E4-1]|nr:hypothetical protein SynBIOSE41_01939 [Synechococcus sp. BIOS-E4-1]